MAKLRIEFTTLGSVRGRLGGQVDARTSEPIGSLTLEVGETATAPENRPSVPTGAGTLFAELTAIDAALYVDVGSPPDPASEPRLLLLPGRPQLVHVVAGQAVAAVTAPDVAFAAPWSPATLIDRSGTLAAGAAAQQACAARSDRRLLIVSNPDEARIFWFNTTGAASAGAGSHAVPPGGAFVFDRVVPAGAVSIFGSAAAQAFTVKEA